MTDTAEKHAEIADPDLQTARTLWIILVSGMIGLLAISLGGLIYALADDKSTHVVLTAFTTLFAGLVGLFLPSPVRTLGGS